MNEGLIKEECREKLWDPVYQGKEEKDKEKTQLGHTGNAKDKMVLKGKIRLLYCFIYILLIFT